MCQPPTELTAIKLDFQIGAVFCKYTPALSLSAQSWWLSLRMLITQFCSVFAALKNLKHNSVYVSRFLRTLRTKKTLKNWAGQYLDFLLYFMRLKITDHDQGATCLYITAFHPF